MRKSGRVGPAKQEKSVFFEKVRVFFEMLGERSLAKTRKALDYEWTSHRAKDVIEAEEEIKNRRQQRRSMAMARPMTSPSSAPITEISEKTEPVQVLPHRTTVEMLVRSMSVRVARSLLHASYPESAQFSRIQEITDYLMNNPEALRYFMDHSQAAIEAKKQAHREATQRRRERQKTAKRESVVTNEVAVKTVAKPDVELKKSRVTPKVKKTTTVRVRKPRTPKSPESKLANESVEKIS